MACYVHVVEEAKGKIIPFSDVNRMKFAASFHQWKSTGSREAEIAKNFEIEQGAAPERLAAIPHLCNVLVLVDI